MKVKLKYIISIILIIIFTFSVVPRRFQNDTFYVIELGKQIEKTGIDWQDHYSIHENLEYRYPHWLFDLLNSNIYENFGFNGIYVLTQVFASILILLIFGNCLRKGINFNLAFVTSLIVAYMMKGAFYARGQIVSYSLFFIEYVIIESLVEKPTILKILGLFIVSCLMANIHSTAWIMMLVLLLPLIGEQIVYLYSFKGINERLLKRYNKKLKIAKSKGLSQEKIEKLENQIKQEEEFKEKNEANKRDYKIIITKQTNIKWIWIAMLVLIIGALVTPLKSTPFLYFIKTSVGNTMSYINEHLPIVPANSLEFFTYTGLMVTLLGFTNVKLKLSDGFLILGLYLMTLIGRRNIFLLISLTSCIIIKLIDDFIKSNIKIENKKTTKKWFVVLSIASVIVSVYMFVIKIGDKYINEETYPVKATQYIKENLDYKNIRMYNGYDYGSYLLMEGIPVFLDSRCDLYTPEFNKGVTVFDDYMDVASGRKSISALMDDYDLEYAIVRVNEVEQTYISDDSRYSELYKDKNFAVYKYDASK